MAAAIVRARHSLARTPLKSLVADTKPDFPGGEKHIYGRHVRSIHSEESFEVYRLSYLVWHRRPVVIIACLLGYHYMYGL